MENEKPKKRLVIGWLEEVDIPEFKVEKTTAKIDTGAYTSSLHATKIRPFLKDGESYVSFFVQGEVKCEKKVHSQRMVKSSNGHEQLRIVIETEVVLGKRTILTQFTLANRNKMDFSILLGRKYLRKNYVVDVAKQFRIRKLALLREAKKKL